MNYLLVLVCSFLVAGGSLFTQQGNKPQQIPDPTTWSNQVEVKTDRFSQATTVKLKPQMILDTLDHCITMRLEAKFGDKKIRDEAEHATEIRTGSATMRFDSLANVPTDFGNKELHFIVDGKPLRIGESSGGTPSRPDGDPSLKPGYKVLKMFFNSLDTDELKKIAGGQRVEMRLGKYEFVLNSTVLGNVREFVREFTKYAPSTKLKERQP